MLRRKSEKRSRILRAGSLDDRDGDGISRLVAERDAQSEGEQQREHEHPEHDLRFALEFEQARGKQVAIARPAPVSGRETERTLDRGSRSFVCDVHRFVSADSVLPYTVVPKGHLIVTRRFKRRGPYPPVGHLTGSRFRSRIGTATDRPPPGLHLFKNSSNTSGVRPRASSNSPFFWLTTSLPSLSTTASAGIPLFSGISYCCTRSAFLC